MSNIECIAKAKEALNAHYFMLANMIFIQSQGIHQALIEQALTTCLKIASVDENSFYSQFKIVVTESYFSENMDNLRPLPPIIFNYLKKSYLYPEQTLEVLKTEKARNQKGAWI